MIIDALIEEDLIAAGESVEIRKAVRDDVRPAARTVGITGRVDGHVVAAGDEVRLEAGSSVGDWIWVGGRSVVIAGRVGQELRAGGQHVLLSGNIAGDAVLIGDTIRVESGASIGGDLILETGQEPEIAEDATVAGEIIRRDFEGFGREAGIFGNVVGTFIFSIGLAIAVLGVFFLFPLFRRRRRGGFVPCRSGRSRSGWRARYLCRSCS